MAKKVLTRTVGPIHNEEDGQDYIFEAGAELPGWADGLVSNPAAFEDDEAFETSAERDAVLNERGRAIRRVASDGGDSAKSSGSSKRAPAKSDE